MRDDEEEENKSQSQKINFPRFSEGLQSHEKLNFFLRSSGRE